MRIEQAWAKLHEAADLAAARGSLLFHLDLATEFARVAFAAHGIAADTLAALADERGYRVIAFDAAAQRAIAEVTFDPNGRALVLPAPGRVPPRALLLAEARGTIATDRFGDDRARAAIVIPKETPGAAIEGYALVVGDDPEIAHLAGHQLVTVDSAGRRITARDPIDTSRDRARCPSRTLRDTPLVVGGAVPNELHTYLSLKHGVPLIVETEESGVRWRVDGERTRTD